MWPSTLTSFTNPQANDRLNNPSHSSIETAQNNAIAGVQTFIGVNTGASASAVGTLLYDVRAPGSNGGGHVQTANKGGTGQTSYSKGDVLVAQSSSVLTKLAVGINDQVLTADSNTNAGVKWGNQSGGKTVTSIFITSVWSRPSNITPASRTLVELWGGGGGGASADATGEGGGGGGGAYNTAWFVTSMLQSSILVIVGNGGAGVGTGGGTGQDGIAGEVTVFGDVVSILSAFGGGGGGNNTAGGGGGGGGGLVTAGANSADQNGANGGLLIAGGTLRAGTGGNTNVAGSVAAYMGWASGGAGGGGDGQAGGQALMSGGGGGGARSGASGAGGISSGGGNGQAASALGGPASPMSVLAASRPGGGGGASYGGGQTSSGAGGPGMAVITTFI